ncbi:hypothetical protein BT63DRAFT_96877 [Microthyrium microscopicum]|uniref:Ricin B lectin domain-containing protein n=1 Tax=Microthyrium microscopicum TaxID=703497 RepID=A0A6A6TXC1_9PEZI|nr:hypothetical protein BT63DRAFT_96877 [Microthyrium microscopicum]
MSGGTGDLEGSFFHLTNTYTGFYKELSTTADDSVVLQNQNGSDLHHQWYFSSTGDSGFYYMHTQGKGQEWALDIMIDNGVLQDTGVHMAPGGSFSGQYWRVDSWDDGTYRLSNNFTSSSRHLDVYADTLKPFMGSEDHSGQHWNLQFIGRWQPKRQTVIELIEPSPAMDGSIGMLPDSTTSYMKAKWDNQEGAMCSLAFLVFVLGAMAIFTCWLKARKRSSYENNKVDHHQPFQDVS